MANYYTVDDLVSSDRIFANRLKTRTLQDFYQKKLAPNTYIYLLSNGERIHLTFDFDQFCHLIGLSYFNYNGIIGWNSLKRHNIVISKLPNFQSMRREEYRITNFHKILRILELPTVYLYKNENLNYRFDYFAVYKDDKRYYKLGIGTSANNVNYGETFQVSLIDSKDNNEIDPNKRLTVVSQYTMPRDTFMELYYPLYLKDKNNTVRLKEVELINWNISINSETN